MISDSVWSRIDSALDEAMTGVTIASDADMRMKIWDYIFKELDIPGRLTVRWELFDYFDEYERPGMPRTE